MITYLPLHSNDIHRRLPSLDIREFKIPQREWQCQFQNLFL